MSDPVEEAKSRLLAAAETHLDHAFGAMSGYLMDYARDNGKVLEMWKKLDCLRGDLQAIKAG